MGKIVEAIWDCKYCNTNGIGGSKRECPFCGKPRDDNTKFYMPKTITYVDEDTAKKVSRKPDWVCNFCNSLNPDTTGVCTSCGASRTAECLDYFENQMKKTNEGMQPRAAPETVSFCELEEPKNESSSHDTGNGNTHIDNFKNFFCDAVESAVDFIFEMWRILALLAIVAIIIAGIVWLVTPRAKTVVVQHKFWERTITIEKYQTVNESDWSFPDGARLITTNDEVIRHETVVDHTVTKTRRVKKQREVGKQEKVIGYKDLGNGYFEEITTEVPIYEDYYDEETYQENVYRDEEIKATKYYYEIDKWLYDRSLTTSGTDSEPYWADISNLKSDERKGGESSSYTFYGIDEDGKTSEYLASYSDWYDLNVNDKITIKVSVFGKVKSIEYHNKEE